MNDLITIFLIIFSELALIEMIAIYIILKKRKSVGDGTDSGVAVDPDQARAVFKKIKENSSHKTVITERLKNQYGMEEDQLEEAVQKILIAESSISGTALKAVAGSNCELISNIPQQQEALQQNYDELLQIVNNRAIAHAEQLESDNKDLQVEVEKLRLELKTTLTTMDRTLSEYSHMYEAAQRNQEEEEQFDELKTAVSNTKQHVDHTMKVVDETVAEKSVPMDQEEIDKRSENQPTAETAPDEVVSELIMDAGSESISEILEQESASDINSSNDVSLNIDDDIDTQIEATPEPEPSVDISSQLADMSEEIEIDSVLQDIGNEDAVLSTDPEADSDIADLLNDANDIDLSEDLDDILSEGKNMDMDIDMDIDIEIEEKKVATK